MEKRAFVLSGGSIRGAFQAGVLSDLLTSNSFIPDAIYGTSVGSLNGAFIAERAGRAVAVGKKPDWVDIGNELQQFWLKNVTSFEKVGTRRSTFGLVLSIIRNKFESFIDMDPLYDLLKREIQLDNLRRSPMKFYACAVNILDGAPVYASIETHENMLDYIIASTAIPMVMPLRIIDREPYTDGGIREVAPLRRAIIDGATDIVCIVCQPKLIQRKAVNWKNIIELMEQHMEIVTNETVNNDIDHCIEINDLLEHFSKNLNRSPLQEKRYIKLQEIRPLEPVALNLEKFTSVEIKNALKQGWDRSQQIRLTKSQT